MATVFTPYTNFVAILAGLVLGGAAALLLGGAERRSLARSITAAVALLTCVLVLPVLWRGASGLDDARAGLRSPDPNARHDKCFIDRGRQAQLAIVYWLQGQMAADDSFAVESSSIDRACFALVMLPRRLVRPTDRPDWTVVVGRVSPALRLRAREERRLAPADRRVRVFERDAALLRER